VAKSCLPEVVTRHQPLIPTLGVGPWHSSVRQFRQILQVLRLSPIRNASLPRELIPERRHSQVGVGHCCSLTLARIGTRSRRSSSRSDSFLRRACRDGLPLVYLCLGGKTCTYTYIDTSSLGSILGTRGAIEKTGLKINLTHKRASLDVGCTRPRTELAIGQPSLRASVIQINRCIGGHMTRKISSTACWLPHPSLRV